MKSYLSLFMALVLSATLCAQKKAKVLFIGDSYTYVNNLPLTVANIAGANGDTLTYSSSTPGGYTLEMQCGYAPTLAAIAQGGYDYVVIQAQSEEPSFPPAQVDTATFPYAAKLDSLVHLADSCTEVVFFLTWGHQNGDPLNCPYYSQICTYAGMQDRLTESYLQMGQMNHASVSPVGEAWRTIFNTPHAYDMYETDSIHPSIFGTYLAASVFYEILFQKSVVSDTFVTAGIPDSTALQLRQTAHNTVYDSLGKWLGPGHIPIASFSSNISGGQVSFSSTSLNGSGFSWNYGDGQTGSGATSSHSYTASGTYLVTLTVYEQCKTSVYTDSVTVQVPSGLNEFNPDQISIYPNPTSALLNINIGNPAFSDIVVYNELGQEVKRVSTADSGIVTMDVSGFAAGIYTVIASKNNQGIHKQFLVSPF